MIQIAILGYGVVGSGVAKALEQNCGQIKKKAGQAIAIKYVLDKRDFTDEPVASMLIQDFEKIENDDGIQIVVEAMGGLEPAYDYVKRALLRGKSVCTSNKELVAKHGAELISIAKTKKSNFLFEASVGGGIPIIRPVNLALATDEIQSVSGILNGTSNYILTQMQQNGTGYAEALQEAQKLGYAESDPTADVGGFDACRKLAILLSLATGSHVDYGDIQTEGITAITERDFAFAQKFGFTLKLMGDGRIHPDGIEAMTAPFLVPQSEPLSAVNDVYNGVMVQGAVTGKVMFYGPGAGFSTAGAVISDIVDAARRWGTHIPHIWEEKKAKIFPVSQYVRRKMLRISCQNPAAFMEKPEIPTAQALTLPDYPECLAWLTPPETEAETEAKIRQLKTLSGFKSIESVIRVCE